MKKNGHEIVIIGAGLAALAAAARLYELGKRDIAVYTEAYGGTPYIAAINFVLKDNKYGDTKQQYAQDMIKAGYEINNKDIVEKMCNATEEGYELLKRWNVEFAHESNGDLKRRHASGSTYPRSLCCTTELIGVEIVNKLEKGLIEKGVQINMGCECVKVLSDKKRVFGVTIKDGEKIYNVYSPIVIAAWGGVGNLFGSSTYPKDIKGNTISIAKNAGARLVDMEFLEYEPMVVIYPESAKGEPCPTAMLGEGAYVLNSKNERFILNVRPQGEAGTPKTLLNKEIWKQVAAGNGSPHGGVFVDLRHIPVETLKAYPWFYNRVMDAGVDPSKEFVEVGPMAHSYSGGILIDENYESNIKGFYAVGEAAGSIHGACRLAGNAAAQATLSGLLCAQAIAKADYKAENKEFDIDYKIDKNIYEKYVPEIKKLAAEVLGVYRNGKDMESAEDTIESMINETDIKNDTMAYQIADSVLTMLTAAIERKESRGTHMRTDFMQTKDEFKKEIIIG